MLASIDAGILPYGPSLKAGADTKRPRLVVDISPVSCNVEVVLVTLSGCESPGAGRRA
jgi:hypothetical protein